MRITVINKTRSAVAGGRIKNKAARIFRELERLGLTKGKNYELYLVFIDKKESQRINSVFRGQPHPTDVLSFDYGGFGEILLTPYIIRREAESRRIPFDERAARLIAHSALHLCGLDHGDRGRQANRALKTENRLLGALNIANF